jgi:hypothetical protein
VSGYEVIGCTDEQTVCDFCGRQDLAKTVILRSLDDGEIVRVGTTCAIKASAIPGARTRAQLDRKVYAAQVEVDAIRYGYEQAVAVLADPERLMKNWQVRVNAPNWRTVVWTPADERAYWTQARDNAEEELRSRT